VLATLCWTLPLANSQVVETHFEWQFFPDNNKFTVLGLPWISENAPKLWRMPASKMEALPKGVQNRAKCSSGGRILLNCTTSQLAIRFEGDSKVDVHDFEVFVNGESVRMADVPRMAGKKERLLFSDLGQQRKEIVIYLPHVDEIRVTAIRVDTNTKFSPPSHSFARDLPIVFYGSSVCQGSGATHSGQTYEAIVGRELNLDFVNLGFGGAGKAEANVVELVNSIPACCYVFDLGKSYGAQDATAFNAMIEAVRKSHPDTPIVALTPITSAKEVVDPSYSQRSLHTRRVMREPVQQWIERGDKQLYLVEGEELLGFQEHMALSKDGVHPSDQGYAIIARKLIPVLELALQLKVPTAR